MTRRAALLILALAFSPVFSATHAAQAKPLDLTGKWNGTFIVTVNGEQDDDLAFLSFTQKGADLTGTAGPSLEEQWPIVNGKVDGTKVTFGAQTGGPLIKFALTLVDGRLKGEATAEDGGMVMTAKVDVGRSK